MTPQREKWAAQVRSLIRGLRARLRALLAVAVTVAVGAAFAAQATTAWSTTLPLGARADLAGSAASSIVVSKPLLSAQDYTNTTRTVDSAVAQDAPGIFAVEQTVSSEAYDLPDSTPADPEQTYAVSAPAVQAHARLTAGTWPDAATVASPHGPQVPVALPVSVAALMQLHVGDTLTVDSSPNVPAVTFLVVGEFQYLASAPDQAALAWNTIGTAGISFSSPPVVLYGPMVAATSAFVQGGPLHVGTGSWTLVPVGAPSLPALQNAVQTVTGDPRLGVWKSYQMATPISGELAATSARVTAGRAELTAAAFLLGLLAGLALAAAAGNLVARGASQAALMRSRGAPAWKLAGVYLPDTILLFAAAALGTLAQGPLFGTALLRIPPLTPAGGGLGPGLPAADWATGLAVACVAAAVVLTRAARAALPAQVAAAAGRQSAVSGLARAGVDLGLVALAGVALWQASNTGLVATGTGGNPGVVLIVACAPALATAAGAAVCGRLVTAAAQLSERVAGRARTLPARLAAWELARTPLRHLVPALLSVAAVAGCGYVAAQHASWQRSAHDQAAFQVGADVAVNLAQPQPLNPAVQLATAQDVEAATPVYTSTPSQGPALIAVDARSASQTVDLRADQADRPLPALWSTITPATEPGIALPGRPVALGIEARLLAPGLLSQSITMTVEDASGIAYTVTLGDLPADGVEHTLQAVIAPNSTKIDYPLRLVSVNLGYVLPQAAPLSGVLTVAAVTARAAGQASAIPVAGAATALGTWTPGMDWNADDEPAAANAPAITTQHVQPGSGLITHFSTGAVGGSQKTELMLTAGSTAILPAIATTAFLKANNDNIGSVVDVSLDQASVPARIVASVRAFPGAVGADSQAVIVDLGELSDQALLADDPLAPVQTWWLHTANGATPRTLPVAAVAENTVQTQAALVADPLAAIPQRVLTIGAAALVLLAILGLLVSLLAAVRDSTMRDTVLSALGMTRPQRAALGFVLHTCVAAPAAVLGAALGFILARLLVPVFVLSPAASRPEPPPTVLFAAPWSLLAAALIIVCTALAALAASAVRRDPSATSRTGG